MSKKRGLGRGLDALLSTAGANASASAESHADSRVDGELRELDIDIIQRGKYQPRIDMHPQALEELADSIRAQGVVQPIVVRPIGQGRYEIIAGERRWRASQLAGKHSIPALIREVPDEAAMAMALIENIQREELNPMEEASALQRLIDEFGMTHQQAAQAVGRSRAAVSNLLRLLSLSEEVKRLLSNGDLEMGHARALLALEGEAQAEAARTVAARGLSVRETERLVKRLRESAGKPRQAAVEENPDIRRLQDELGAKLGAAVKIHYSANGKGRLEIKYNNLEELEGILAHIR